MFSLETTPCFDEELLVVLDFIALDSPNRALEFYDTLMTKLNNIPENPFMYRRRKKEVIYFRNF
jgi:plasmid stabilization system protein ParE